MSNAALFFSGLLVTLAVSVGIGLLVWGAILDGRYDREVRASLEPDASENGRPARVGEAALSDSA